MLRFSHQNRLRTKLDFQRVFDGRVKVARQSLVALNIPNGHDYARLGVVVGKHFLKRAVDRNRLRRIVRESFRHQQEALQGRDIVILLRRTCSVLDKAVLRQEIDKLWQQLITSLKPV